MSRPLVRVPQPKALRGEQVEVLNYLKRRRETWEGAEVRMVTLEVDRDGRGTWQYYVILDRRGASGYPIFLTVNDQGLVRDDAEESRVSRSPRSVSDTEKERDAGGAL